ncbi:MAG TPA: hypothetical protein PK781_00055 [Terrimesophilobacter sp.]|nr:hypothetical protein [Terrimesophilobacter sp.]
MADYIENGLRAMTKSLRDVVLPAVDPGDPLAKEQLSLAIEYLEFLRTRSEYLALQARWELTHYLEMADQVVVAADESDLSGDLITRAATARDAIGDPTTVDKDLRAESEKLAAGIQSLLASVPDSNAPLRARIERVILDATLRWIEFGRSWYEPLAIDPGAAELPSFELALRAMTSAVGGTHE